MKHLVLFLLLSFLSLLFFGGCTATYRHATKSPADFERDRQECELIAKKVVEAKGPACG